MPNSDRVRAAFQARAALCAFACGAQTFLIGTGVCIPLSLNAAYLAVLPSLALAACCAVLARKRLARGFSIPPKKSAKALRLLLAGTLLACCCFQLTGLLLLALSSLLPQAQRLTAALLTLSAVGFCAVFQTTGAARLAYALRVLLPLLLLATACSALQKDAPVGLFPVLGTGAGPLFLSALCALSAAVPCLLLFLPPPELDNFPPEALPPACFFVRRVLLGMGMGAALLFFITLCNTYVTLRAEPLWGPRMLVISRSRPQEGMLPALLMLGQMTALLLGAAGLLAAAEEAFCAGWPRLKAGRKGLALGFALLLAALPAPLFLPASALLGAAVLLILPFFLLLVFSKKL